MKHNNDLKQSFYEEKDKIDETQNWIMPYITSSVGLITGIIATYLYSKFNFLLSLIIAIILIIVVFLFLFLFKNKKRFKTKGKILSAISIIILVVSVFLIVQNIVLSIDDIVGIKNPRMEYNIKEYDNLITIDVVGGSDEDILVYYLLEEQQEGQLLFVPENEVFETTQKSFH